MKEQLSKITGFVSKCAVKAGNYIPTALVVVGIGGVVAATVMACKKTKKTEEIVKEFEEKKEELKSNDFELTKGEYRREMAKIYMGTTKDLAKNYCVPAAIGVVSIGCIIGSHRILTKRVAGLTAAYSAVDSAFKRYRKNVVDTYGEEADKNLKIGKKIEEVEKAYVNAKGEEKVKKEKVETVDHSLDDVSDYGRWFCEGTTDQFQKNSPAYNLSFLQGAEKYWDSMLQYRGHVFLNEVYDYLGFARTPAGQVVGWVKGGSDYSDNHVRFGIIDGSLPSKEGYFLDFNVDGVVYNLI